ncbi:LPS biosynthesis protein [Thermoplasmatales archaeon BRNA1]|nr:LPS biosynthesis protein [Thermoplasmatales archaeon BRNA1]
MMNDIQENLLEIMTDVDAALRKGGVFYTMYSGTALGAARHHGFIPWDDDMDIVVKAEDLDAFKDALAKYLPEGKYYLQEPLSIDWANSFYKIKLNNSTGVERSHLHTRMHQGLFIDVFPAREYPNGKFRRKMYEFLLFCQKGVRVLSFRNYGKPRRDIIQKPITAVHRLLLRMMAGLCEKDCRYYRVDYVGEPYPILDKKIFEDALDWDFEGHQFKLIRDYDYVLTQMYGDYMTLPPEEKRVGHHNVFFDRNIDYKDWLERYFREHPDEKR